MRLLVGAEVDIFMRTLPSTENCVLLLLKSSAED